VEEAVLDVVRIARPEHQVLQEWDRLVEAADAGEVVQLSAWAEVRAPAGYTPSYILVRDGRQLVGGAQLLIRKVRGIGSVTYLPYGPVIAPHVDRVLVRAALVDALSTVAARTQMLFVQPPHGAEDISSHLIRRGFRESGAGVAPAVTLRLDITQSEADLRAGLSRRTRSWTKQWPNRGVTVRVGDRVDVPLLARLLAMTAEHQGFTPLSCTYLAGMYDVLAPRGHAVLLIGEVEGRPAAAELFTACGGVVTGRVCGFDRSPDSMRLNVAAAVTWKAIQWARTHGYRVFDLGGLDPKSQPAKGAVGTEDFDGADRYKAKFGGRIVNFPAAVELISSPLVRAVYDYAQRSSSGQQLLAATRVALRGGRARRARYQPRQDASFSASRTRTM
jgi:lipid II:glycine glycyltransferase (peptidoglycan interpeptide bridge formation enzyme)